MTAVLQRFTQRRVIEVFSIRPDSFYLMDDAINIDRTIQAICAPLYQSFNWLLRIGALAIAGSFIFLSEVRPAASQGPPGIGPMMSAQRIFMPPVGAASAGFRFEVRHERLTQFGDLAMRVLVTPATATFPEDRELTLRVTFDPQTVSPSGFAANYHVAISLKSGETLTDQTFYLPKWFLRGDFRLTVWEAGQPLAGYSASQTATWYDNSNEPFNANWLESIWLDSAVSRFGWIATPGSKPLASVNQGSELDDIRVLLLSLIPELGAAENLISQTNLHSLLKTYGEIAGFRYRTIEELPSQWQGMQQCHVWIMEWSTWEHLENNNPQVALAMQQYVRCGGTLWLVNSPTKKTVAESFGVKTRKAETSDAVETSVLPNPGGRLLDQMSDGSQSALPDFGNTVNMQRLYFPLPDFSQIIGSQYSNTPLTMRHGLLTALQSQLNQSNSYWQPNTALLKAHLGDDVLPSEINSIEIGPGIVVCCSHNDSVQGSYFQWLQMREMTGTRLSSVVNRGVDPVVGDGRFWNWTIPGVAQPPVYTFIGLLFLFVILVGPIAYRKLTKLGRGYLMFFVAPVLAAGTTMILFVYGVIADGIGTQARIRQVTWLCEADGGAVQYWRSTYFAGFRPADGLRFPKSTLVQPYRTNEYENWYMLNYGDNSTQGTITLSDDGVRLSSGFIPSRQQRQFVAYRPLENAGGLALKMDDDDGNADVTSRFTYDLREVVVCDSSGGHWLCETLKAGSTQRAVLMAEVDVAAKLSGMYMRQMPVSPPGVIRGGRRGRTSLDLVTNLAVRGPFQGSPVMTRAATGESQIDWWLRETLQTGSELPPLMFVAIADVSSECIANPRATLVESIHYVVGDVR